MNRSTSTLPSILGAGTPRGHRRPAAPPVLVHRPAGPTGTVDPAADRALDLVTEALVAQGTRVLPLDWDDHLQTLLGDHEAIVACEGEPGGGPTGPTSAAVLAAYQDARIRRDVSRSDLVHRLGDGGLVVGPADSEIFRRPWQVLGLPVTLAEVRTGAGATLALQVIGLPGREAAVEAFAHRLQALLAGAAAHGVPVPGPSVHGTYAGRLPAARFANHRRGSSR